MNSELDAPLPKATVGPGDHIEIAVCRPDRGDFKLESSRTCRTIEQFEAKVLDMARALWRTIERAE